jgi:colicin import membrane protein
LWTKTLRPRILAAWDDFVESRRTGWNERIERRKRLVAAKGGDAEAWYRERVERHWFPLPRPHVAREALRARLVHAAETKDRRVERGITLPPKEEREKARDERRAAKEAKRQKKEARRETKESAKGHARAERMRAKREKKKAARQATEEDAAAERKEPDAKAAAKAEKLRLKQEKKAAKKRSKAEEKARGDEDA